MMWFVVLETQWNWSHESAYAAFQNWAWYLNIF